MKIGYFQRPLLILSAVLLCHTASSQRTLADYLAIAMRENLVLRQKNISLDRSLLALQEASSLFRPNTSLEGQYLLSQGGRRINLPIGDLLNPVYATLNQLTSSGRFPQIENVAEQLTPNNFYDVRIRTSVPIVNRELTYNRNVKEKQIILQEQEVNIYTRELVKEVKTAYYTILMARKAVDIYASALTLVGEYLRVSSSLLANGKGLPAYVSRAEAEVFQVDAQLSSSREQVKKAEAWFNALLNRKLSTEVIVEEIPFEHSPLSTDTLSGSKREELQQLEILRAIQGETMKLHKAFYTPKLNAFVDLAAQDFNFRIRQQSFFYLSGLQFNMPLYVGQRNRLQIRQIALDLKNSALQQQEVKNKLDVAVLQAQVSVKTNHDRYLLALKQEAAAKQYFKLIDRGYREGVNSFIEWLDGRNQLTQTQLQKEVALYAYLTTVADLERQAASFPLQKN